jgi:hypothetical protein
VKFKGLVLHEIQEKKRDLLFDEEVEKILALLTQQL